MIRRWLFVLVLVLVFLWIVGCASVRPLEASPGWPPAPPPLAPLVSPREDKNVEPPPRTPPSPTSRPVCFSRGEIAAILRAKRRLADWPKRCNTVLEQERKRHEALCRRERGEKDALLKDCQSKKQPVCGTLCWIGIGTGVVVGIGIGVGITVILERTRK